MKNMRKTAEKLQTALGMIGVPVSIEEKRWFSIAYKRPMTRYIVKVKRRGERPEPIIETYSLVEVVKALAARLEEEKAKKS